MALKRQKQSGMVRPNTFNTPLVSTKSNDLLHQSAAPGRLKAPAANFDHHTAANSTAMLLY